MPVGAVIGGSAIIGGVSSAISGSAAADAQLEGANNAVAASERATQLQVDEAKRQYDLTRSDYAPYRSVGYGSLGKLASLYGVTPTNADGTPATGVTTTSRDQALADFYTSPQYTFARDQGLTAIDRQNAARGVLNSGGADKARMRYAEGLASGEYNSYVSNLAQLAGVGQAATGSTAAAGSQASSTISSAYGANGANQAAAATAAGNARASSYANTGSAISGTVGNLASAYLYSQGGYGGTTYGGTPPIYGGRLGGIY